MKKLLLVLLLLSLLLVACEPNQPKLPSRHDQIPSNHILPLKENITEPEPVPEPVINNTIPAPISKPEDIPEPVINDTVPEPIPKPIPKPEDIPEPAFVYSKDTFFTDVLVDLESFSTSDEEIEEVMEIASFKFEQLTGYNLELREIYYSNQIIEPSIGDNYKNFFEYKLFLNNNKGLNGVIVLTEKRGTTSSGGFSTYYHYLDYCNQFNNDLFDADLENTLVYFSYIDFGHKYSTCGYDYENDQHVSSVSLPGECQNQLGTQCIFNGDYYICENAQENYYAQENVFVACTIVHEFMHPFGKLGNYDHYGSPQCNEAMGISSDEATIEESQYYCGLCPNIYENFKDSFVEC